jgi:hypothetical protein
MVESGCPGKHRPNSGEDLARLVVPQVLFRRLVNSVLLGRGCKTCSDNFSTELPQQAPVQRKPETYRVSIFSSDKIRFSLTSMWAM